MTSLDFPDLSIDSMSLLFYLNDMDKSDCQSAPQHDQSGLVSPEISDWHMNEVFQSIPDIDELEQSAAMVADVFPMTPALENLDDYCADIDIVSYESPDCADLVPTTVDEAQSTEQSISPQHSQSDDGYTAPTKKRRHAVGEAEVEVKSHETKKRAIRRVKNNMASREFRSRKKTKLEVNTEKVSHLERENEKLRSDLQSVEDVVRILKDGLVKNAQKFHNK